MEGLQRLYDLREVGRTLLTPPLTNTLGFGRWDCGTYACFYGHYRRNHAAPNPLLGFSSNKELVDWFGITPEEFVALFGGGLGPDRCIAANYPGFAAYTELKKRMEILDGIIARKEAELEVREAA